MGELEAMPAVPAANSRNRKLRRVPGCDTAEARRDPETHAGGAGPLRVSRSSRRKLRGPSSPGDAALVRLLRGRTSGEVSQVVSRVRGDRLHLRDARALSMVP